MNVGVLDTVAEQYPPGAAGATWYLLLPLFHPAQHWPHYREADHR